GRAGTAGFMDSLGYGPGRRYALIGGLSETVGGAFLVLGLLTPLAAAIIVGMMLNATLAVHLQNGVWVTNGGYELPLVMGAAAAAIALAGAGTVSVDNILGLSRLSGVWGLFSVFFGLLVGARANSPPQTDEGPVGAE